MDAHVEAAGEEGGGREGTAGTYGGGEAEGVAVAAAAATQQIDGRDQEEHDPADGGDAVEGLGQVFAPQDWQRGGERGCGEGETDAVEGRHWALTTVSEPRRRADAPTRRRADARTEQPSAREH